MRRYQARMMNTVEGEVAASYPFEGPDDLFDMQPDQIIHRFFEHVDKDIFHHHIDYEISTAFKDQHGTAVTATGSLLLEHDGHLPFLLVISA